MRTGATQWLRVAALLALGAAYPLAAHWFTVDPALTEYGAILAVAPWMAIGVALAWHSTRRALAIAVCLAVVCVLYFERGTLMENFTWVYFAQHAGTFLLLAVAFGRTMGRGCEPMCSRFARAVHGPLDDDVARYTRQITAAWTVFFVVMCVLSAMLFFLAPLSLWSLFANLVTPILVAGMFGAEYLVRLRVLPDFEHIGLLRSVRAIWVSSSAEATSAETR